MKISLLRHAVPAPTDSTPAPAQRNLDPLLHPLSRARERKRALNASKMERMFSKPFVASFEGHEDSVCSLERIRGRLGCIASAGFDGKIIIHSLSRRVTIQTIYGAHRGKISGLAMAQGDRILSAGHDTSIKLWALSLPNTDDGDDAENTISDNTRQDLMAVDEPPEREPSKPIVVYPGKTPFNSIHHHRYEPLFATASNGVHRWKYDNEIGKVLRSRPTPKSIKSAARLKRTMEDAAKEKEDRRRKHSRLGETNPKAERKKLVIAVND
ncbi:rRNA-processing protein sof1 [Serendipita sp. 411]|nr:rRNA-processing protein sof1 [Serendipita sp. 411]